MTFYRFYEINPEVIDLAQGKKGYFSYLQDSAGRIQIAPGDARLSLEAEAVISKTSTSSLSMRLVAIPSPSIC